MRFRFVSIKKIGQGSSIDYVVSQFPAVKRNFLFLVIQEYYRNYENNNKINDLCIVILYGCTGEFLAS